MCEIPNMLIDRRIEVAGIRAELHAAAIDRRVSTVLLRGPGGIGKSTIAAEILRHAAADGVLPLLGRADDFDRGAPFGVFRDAFSRVDPSRIPPAARSAFAELRESLDIRSLVEAAPGPASRRRDRILVGLAELLPRLTDAGPAVLVLEDLHAADPDSLALAALLGRNIADVPMLLLLTCRSGYEAHLGELHSFVGRLVDDGRASVIDLPPMTRPAIGELLTDTIGTRPAVALLDAVWKSSGGNPFFARAIAEGIADGSDPAELIRSAAGIGSERNAIGPDRDVPALLSRFFAARDPEFEAASALAVFGRFDLAHLYLLEAVTGQAKALTATNIDRLIAKRLLIPAAQGYEFAHPILKDLLYADLGETRRSALHGQIARILHQRRNDGRPVDLFELAAHAYAARHIDHDLALESCREAGFAAADVAPLVAVDWLERTLELMGRADPHRPEVHAQLVYCLILASETGRAIEASRQAFTELPDRTGHVGLALAAAGAMFAGDELAQALAVVDREIDRGADLAWLWSMRAALLGQLGLPDEDDTYSRAKTMVLTCTDPLQAASSASLLMTQSVLTAATEDYLAFDQVLRRNLDSVPALSRSELLHMSATLAAEGATGVLDGARDLAAARALIGPRATISAGGTAELSEILLAYYEGRWDDALRRVGVVAPALRDCGNTTVLIAVQALAVLLRTDRDENDDARSIGVGLRPGPYGTRPLVAIARARLARASGNVEAAIDLLSQQISDARERGHLVMQTMVTEELAALHLQAGDRSEASRVAADGARLAAGAGRPMLDLYADRTMAAVEGDALAGRRAATIAAQQGTPVELARCRVVLGELGHGTDADAQAALSILRRVGAPGWALRAAAVLSERGLTVPEAATGTTGLTASEAALTKLVVEGLSNRQIAAALHYSSRTVEAYLSKVYAKLGVSGRVELISAALGSGELEDRHG